MKTLKRPRLITNDELDSWLSRDPGKLHGDVMSRVDDMILEIKSLREAVKSGDTMRKDRSIKAGTPISGLTTDFLGKNWKNPPSIGAYEYYRKGGNGWGQYNFGFGW